VRRIAVVGSGIAGLAAARALTSHARVTLYEAADYFGGHAHTVDVTLGGRTHAVDTGFLVFNERTSPKLTALFAELGVQTAPSAMTFSAQIRPAGIEWSGAGLDAVFAQRSNLLRPAFWNMLGEIARFNRVATALARDPSAKARAALDDSVGDFLDQHRFSRGFRDWYFLPMIGCIWSCPTEQMLRFPVATLIRFGHSHGLLQLTGRPQWLTVRDGSRCYVERIVEALADARRSTPVRRVRRLAGGGVDVATDAATERFDAVVMACHSDQALAVLADATGDELAVLGAIRYQRNRAILHTDTSLLPLRRRAWAAWNYERGPDGDDDPEALCLHCLVNRVQPLPFTAPVIISLNPVQEPDAASVQGEFLYAHPMYDRRAIAAQARLPQLQGRADTWFCGAWTGYGFHEDGLASALDVCERLVAKARGATPAALP
jgi:predicted NAD/FAD-binding protein